MSLDRIRELLTHLPSHSLVHGGSHSGKLYQNYPWPPLDVLPAHRNDTQQRLDWLLEKLGDVKGKSILDIGCGNAAISIGLARMGATVLGVTADPVEVAIAREAHKIMDFPSSHDIKRWGDNSHLSCMFHTDFHGDSYPQKIAAFCDIILHLSAWKWMVRNEGIDSANMSIILPAGSLIFESGLTDGGMDLGIGITKADIPDILRKHTGCEPELLGIEPREDGTEREVWRCRRSA